MGGTVSDPDKVPNTNGAASPEHADASLRFSGTKDRMKVGVARYIPPRGNGSPLTLERIQMLLEEAGIRVPVSSKGAEKLLQCIAEGQPLDRIVIARGVPPVNGTDAYLIPYGNLNFPVFPGQKIGSKVPLQHVKAGMRIDGSEIPPQAPTKPRDIVIPDDSNCYLEEDTQDITSNVYGLVQVRDSSVDVEPQVHVSGDGMEARGTLYYRDIEGQPVTADRIVLMLQAMKISVDQIRQEPLREALKRCEKTNQPEVDVLLAKGRAPVDGKDGYVQMLQPVDEVAQVGSAGAGGAIDYRNRGVTPSVRTGDPVAMIHPPVPSLPGVDVLGKIIPARDGQPASVAFDASVTLDEDGRTVRAQRDGLGQYVGGVLSVQEVVQIKGDVDFGSGNVQVGTGSVQVKGAVLSGFAVKAPGALVVGEAIESAQVLVGSNVEVAGGIVMQGKGSIKCGGSVTAKFITEASVEARGDVVVLDSILHSTIVCGGEVVATSGRGRIQGGSITCRTGVRAIELGSDIGAPTHVTLVASSKALRELEKERDAVKDALAKIAMKFGEGDDETLLMHAQPEHYKALEMALSLRSSLQTKLETLREQVTEARQKASHKLRNARVQVSGTVHAGTVITIGEAVFSVSHPLQAAVFRYEPTTRSIEVTSAS